MRFTEWRFWRSRRFPSSGRFRQVSAWNGFDSVPLAFTVRPFAAASSTARIAQPWKSLRPPPRSWPLEIASLAISSRCAWSMRSTGDFVIPEAHEEYFRNRPWLSCPLRRRLGEHASTEVLAFGQRRQAPRQETARGAILPVHAGGLATSPRVAARHRRDADARSSLPGTSSTLRLLRCRARSAVPPGRSLT